MKTVVEFKNLFLELIPKNYNYILYIYDFSGQILFRDKWKKLNNIDCSQKIVWKPLLGYFEILKDFSNIDKNICVNFIFQEAVKNLYYSIL